MASRAIVQPKVMLLMLLMLSFCAGGGRAVGAGAAAPLLRLVGA